MGGARRDGSPAKMAPGLKYEKRNAQGFSSSKTAIRDEASCPGEIEVLLAQNG